MEFTINLITPDNGEKFVVELSNATLTNIEGYLADDADLTITINRTRSGAGDDGRQDTARRRSRTAPPRSRATSRSSASSPRPWRSSRRLRDPAGHAERPDGPPDLTDYEVGPVELRGE